MGRFIACLMTLLLAAGAAHAEWVERVDDGIMGTRIVVELWAEDKKSGNEAIEAVLAEMRRVDAAMSTYKPTSELSIVNARAATAADTDHAGTVRSAHHRSRLFAHHGRRLRHHVRERRLPVRLSQSCAPDRASRSRRRCRASTIATCCSIAQRAHVRFARAGVRIDLGGIGKGHAVDRGIALLQGRGVQHALVTAGGDSRIIGDRFGQPWVVGIRHPDRKDEVIAKIPLEDAAISTCGDYERYFDENGMRYHHILDPHTGQSASKVRSATIIGPTATRTDGLSKTAFVLGAERAIEIYEKLGDVDAVLVKPDGTVLYTKGLRAPGPAP